MPKKACPTAVILDTQSVKNAATATGATVGFDAGKLVKGRKRLVLTDTLGHVLATRVVPANAADAIAFWDEVVAVHDLLGQVQVVFVDSSFNGVFREHLAHRYGVRVEKPAHVLVKKPISASMPGGGQWNEPSRGLAQSEDCQKNMTEVCGMLMPGLPWLAFSAFSNAANSNRSF